MSVMFKDKQLILVFLDMVEGFVSLEKYLRRLGTLQAPFIGVDPLGIFEVGGDLSGMFQFVGNDSVEIILRKQLLGDALNKKEGLVSP